MNKSDFIEWCKRQHDVTCNQKYDGNLPYSKHLDFVKAYAYRFKHLIQEGWVDHSPYTRFDCVEMACYGHDLIEDARVTYNDIRDKVGPFIADIIYCCTEERGKTREERHSERYYKELNLNKEAVFVKLCDICANVTYSILTNSSMYKKHKKEHDKTYMYLFRDEYKEIFEFLDNLFTLD